MRFPVHNRIQPIISDVDLRAETQDDFEIRILMTTGAIKSANADPMQQAVSFQMPYP